MKLCFWGKDGGEESTVWGFWLVEMKSLFSVALLKFVGDSREAFHSHAFNSISWVLRGQLREHFLDDDPLYSCPRNVYHPSWKPIVTRRSTVHKVDSVGTTWVLTFRGPWTYTWTEYLPETREYVTLMNGRVKV